MAFVEPVLDIHDIQGNILNGFNKHHQNMLGLRMRGRRKTDIANAREWLRSVLPSVTPVTISRKSKQRAKEMIRAGHPVRLDDLFTALSVSFEAVELLVGPTTGFSQAFVDGQWRRAASILGDDHDGLSRWKVGGTEESTPHFFIVLAADHAARLDAATKSFCALANRYGLHVIYEEAGAVLPNLDFGGYEHFGFLDNIAKVRVRGRQSARAGDYYTRRSRAAQDPLFAEFAAPGQPLIWPGQIILGYDRQSASDARPPIPAVSPIPSWSRNGSYLVFRRLRQHVGEFRQFVRDSAESFFSHRPTDFEIEKFAAMLVGRWRNGTPLVISPNAPLNAQATNEFLYQRPNWPPGSGLPGDTLGTRCPVSAHIRKVNPRDQGSDLGPEADSLRRAILRRGIPYGEPLSPNAQPGSAEWKADRGLLFLCYQSSIENAFETIVQDWMNSTAGPTTPQGFDMLVGQNPARQARFCILDGRNISTTVAFVEATGGGYFFTPALSALQVLAAK
jgi:Dyp-type peroxidase family